MCNHVKWIANGYATTKGENMKKIILFIILSVFLTNCSSYKPIINGETSFNKQDNKNIAKNYYRDMNLCKYIHKENTPVIIRKLGISDETTFVKKCMKEYGYTILR